VQFFIIDDDEKAPEQIEAPAVDTASTEPKPVPDTTGDDDDDLIPDIVE
jgi:hypothetical protein